MVVIMIKVAIQGQIGSFHHEAVNKIFQKEVELLCLRTFSDVFKAVESGQADYGLTAIENNLHGSINEVYRLLEKYNVWISKETRLHISQNLVAYKPLKVKNNDNLKIISHPVALAQVSDWMEANLPSAQKLERPDTAGSVEEVVRLKNDNLLAVAGEFASQYYGGEIIEKDIQDDPNNYTRFILFGKNKIDSKDSTNSSIILTTSHKKGSLLEVLKLFEMHGCNLTKLDSHPIVGDMQHYNFYIDYEIPKDNQKLIEDLRSKDCKVKLLGEYLSIN